MKNAVKILLTLAGIAGAGAAGFVGANLYRNRTDKDRSVTEDDFFDDEEDDPELTDCSDDIGNLFDDLDESVCPEDIDLKAQCPIFGDEKKLLPGEKKFLDEFLDGVQAITTIMTDELDSIDLLARTSNMPCKIKCDKIRDLCKEAHENCHLIAEITDDVLKVLRKEYCWEYRDYINAEIAKMEQEGMKNE